MLRICLTIPLLLVSHEAFAEAVSPRDSGLPDAAPMIGPYLDWRKWTPVLMLMLLWAGTMRWVDLDAGALRLRRRWWNSVVLFAGIAGFGLLLMIPIYFIGWSVAVLAYAVPVGMYVTLRNQKVNAARRVFTVDHLKRLPGDLFSLLARAFRGGGGTSLPVTLFGKTLADGGDDEALPAHVENSPGHRAARELIYSAVQKGATDIHLEPGADAVAVRIRIDGNLTSADPFDSKLGTSVINIFKVLAALDITDKRRSQDGSLRAEVDGERIDVRVATQRMQHGEKLSLRILDGARELSTLESLGIRVELKEQIRSAVQRPHGLFLVCGPTGAGKTTTLYAALKLIDTAQKNVVTVEDPIEYKLAGVNQIEVNVKAGQSIGGALRNILRQDPDVLLIGEIRDAETAALACEAANTGHVVLSTLHANNAAAAFARLKELGVDPQTMANTVSAVLAQRLVRMLCRECKVAYFPEDETLAKLGIDRLAAETQPEIYRPAKTSTSTCRACDKRGYTGRTGIFEFLDVTPDLRKLIADDGSASTIQMAARNQGLTTMREFGANLVTRGVTSIEEVTQAAGNVE